MRREPRLAGLVVIGDDDQRRIGAHVGRGADPLDRCRRRVSAATRDDGHPALHDLDSVGDQLSMLVCGQGRDLAGRPAGHQRIRAFGNLPFHEAGECVLSDTAAGKWRHQRRNRAEKHELASSIGSFLWTSWPRSLADKEGQAKMSSMWRIAVIIPVLLATAPSSSAQYAPPPSYSAAPVAGPSVASSL